MTQTQTIAFLGGGNMARSLIGGLIANGHPAGAIIVSEPEAARREALAAEFAVDTVDDNRQAAERGQSVILAVKPQVAGTVARDIAAAMHRGRGVLISIAAGIPLASLSEWLQGYDNLVRVMPNTPALVGAGASGLFAGPEVDDIDRERAASILAAVGSVEWVADESMIDVITGVSGSGPAYFFYLMESMQSAAEAAGLNSDSARSLVLQTALGAAKLAAAETVEFSELRRRVTSPGGTTERAIAVFEAAGCRAITAAAVAAASERAAQLAAELGT